MSSLKLCPRNKERLNYIVRNFLEKHQLLKDDENWEVRESELGGFGVFASRDFDVGEVIFRDCPVIIGPRCAAACPRVCVNCFSKKTLTPCTKGCGLEVCNEACQNSSLHSKECKIIRQYLKNDMEITDEFRKDLFENLTPIRSLFLDKDDREVVSSLIAHERDDHGHEITTLKNKLGLQFKEDEEKWMRFVCCVMDANAFEVALGNENCLSSIRGLYPLGSLANHSCTPNTIHVFDENQCMVTKAAVFIPKNSEIFHAYTRLIWGTTTRLYHLHRTKHFICKCRRCSDPTEFGTHIGSVLCKLCRGLVDPVNPFKAFARWQCQDCKNVTSGRDSGETMRLLGSILHNIRSDDFEFMYKFLNGKLKSVVPENNQVAVELKYKIIWILGHMEGYQWKALTLEQLQIKEQFCYDLLDLLEQLRSQTKMRALLLYELVCCKRELSIRTRGSKQYMLSDDIQGLLNEAAFILKYDVTAPEEIKQLLSFES